MDTQIISLGANRELVVHGNFDSNVGWILGDGWSIADSIASSDGSQDTTSYIQRIVVGLIKGKNYLVELDISNYVNGGLFVSVGGYDIGKIMRSNGHYRDYIRLLNSLYINKIYVGVGSSFIGSIDNVSIKQVR